MDALYQRTDPRKYIYPEYDREDLRNIDQQAGHEMERNYGPYGATLPQITHAMEAQHGLSPGSDKFIYKAPKNPKAVADTTIDENGTPNIQIDPHQNPNDFLTTLDHELNHAAEMTNGTDLQMRGFPSGPSNSNKLPHFASDDAGQMFPYEQKNAVNSMLNQIQNQNNPDSGLLKNYGPEGLALQSYLQKKQQMGDLAP